MATDELDRYMLSLEGYLRKVDALDHYPRQTLCKTLLPNFGHIGIIFLANSTCPQALRGLQIVIKLIYHAKEFSNSNPGKIKGQEGYQETNFPILDDFIDQLQDKIISGKIDTDKDFDGQRLAFLLPKYRQSLVLTLIKDCLANSSSTDSCIMRNPLTEYCCSLNSLFFTIILTFCDILKLTDGHWFIGKIIGSFKRIVQSNGNTIHLYPPHLRSFLPHLELLDLQLTQQFTISSSSQSHRVADKLCHKLNYSLLPGICEWDEIVALLILYPSAADFLVSHKPEWIHKLRNWSQRTINSNN